MRSRPAEAGLDLFCADEIQTGLGRTGRILCLDHDGIKPDLVLLGKALSGGFYPISAVASRKGILDLFTPGTHGSTYGGNPLACAIGMAALDVIEGQGLAGRAAGLGACFQSVLKRMKHPLIKEVRGKGLLIAIEFKKRACLFNRIFLH